MNLYLLSGDCRKDWDPAAPVTCFAGLPVRAPSEQLARTRAEILLAPFGVIRTIRPATRVPDLALVEPDSWMREIVAQLLLEDGATC